MTRASWLAPSSSSRRAATPTPRPRSRRCRRAAATIASWSPCASPSATTISAGTGRPSPACSRTCRAPSGKPRRASSICPRRARSAITPATWRRPRALASDFKTGAWTEETLNNLATHYIVTDDDATAGDGVRRLSRAVPAGQVRRPRGVAPRLVEVSRRRLRGRRRDLRSGRGQLPALRLPSELAVLGGPRLREGQPDAPRQRPLRAGAHRLSPLLLRTPRRRAPRRRERVALAGRRAAAGGRRCAARRACRRTRPRSGS